MVLFILIKDTYIGLTRLFLVVLTIEGGINIAPNIIYTITIIIIILCKDSLIRLTLMGYN